MIKQVQDETDTRKNLFLDKEEKPSSRLFITLKKEYLMFKKFKLGFCN